MPARRQSDEVLIQMAHDLGKFTGKLDTHIENQDKINANLTRLLEKQDTRSDEIEKRVEGAHSRMDGVKNKFIGWVAGAALGGTGIGATITKFLNHIP